MNLKEVTDYFENLAILNKKVAHANDNRHFFRINIEDILNGQVTDAKFPAVFLEVPEGRYQGDTMDNVQYVKYVALSFLTQAESTDVAAQINAYDDMEIIGREFMSRIAYDYRNRVIRIFDFKQIRAYKLCNVMNGCYGWRYELPLGNISTELQVYVPDNWNE